MTSTRRGPQNEEASRGTMISSNVSDASYEKEDMFEKIQTVDSGITL